MKTAGNNFFSIDVNSIIYLNKCMGLKGHSSFLEALMGCFVTLAVIIRGLLLVDLILEKLSHHTSLTKV